MRHLSILALLLLCLVQSLQAQEDPLKKRITLEYESITLPQLFSEIKKKYHVNFSYAHDLVSERKKLKVTIVNLPFDQALRTVLSNQGLSFEWIGKQIVIKRGVYPRRVKSSVKEEFNTNSERSSESLNPKASSESLAPVASLENRGPMVEEIIEPLPINASAARNVLYQDNREAVKQLKLEVATWKDSVNKIKDPREKFILQHEINRFVEGIETRLIQIKDSIRSMRTKEAVREMGSNLKVSIQQVKESIGAAADSLPRKRRMFERKSTDSTISQMEDGLEVRPGQFTLVYPIGTSWIYSPKYKNTVSINLLFGINGGIKGVDAGGMVNVVRRNLIGVQVGG
ncbi:MAG: STN domain-containing protein, partial [Cytophagales bacterium]|nr:STN domain-containing protein [Cytophagales bacterium]